MKHEHIQHRFIGREMTLTFGGEKIKGNLTKDLEMTNKDKYIPKVGEAFEWCYENVIKWSKANPVILVTDKEVAYKSDNGHLVVVSNLCQFRQIPTKADVEREQLHDFFTDASNFNHSDEWLIKKIQNAGFTIPKKVKRSEIADVVVNNSSMDCVEDENLADEICNLLGDLVEDDNWSNH